jgi:glycine/D-amino acid oxidase-like deaminating enzyme
MDSPEHDVIVVGAGNAALCAALSAREHGARVVVLECAAEAEAGGNSRFAGGVMRFAFDGSTTFGRSQISPTTRSLAPTSGPTRARSTSTTSSA